jgi:glycosyltransferase involved in cell wall biosynthesis
VANGLDYLLACAHESGRAGLPVHFLLCGDGAMLDELKDQAQKLALKNLDFIPFQNRDGVRQVMNVTDAVFICYKSVKILETGSPNKYFDGLAAGKLVVMNFGGWIREEVEREGCGVYVDAGNGENFVEVIKPFVDDAELLKQKQHAARMLGERKYAREELGREFCRIVELEGKGD